jgi:hypothetical protein
MKYTLLAIVIVCTLVPRLGFAQDVELDIGIDELDFEALFEQMDEEIRQDSITTSGFNEERQTLVSPTVTTQPIPVRASSEDSIYSTDEKEIILYRQKQEVKRLPFTLNIADVNTQPDTGKRMQDEVVTETNDYQNTVENDPFNTSTLVQDTEFEDMHSASGTGTDADSASGAIVGETLGVNASGSSSASTNTLTLVVATIAIVIGGLFGMSIMRKRKLDSNMPDMPSNLNDATKMRKLEEALSKTH